MFSTHVDTVFLEKPYFSATRLFDMPYSRSFEALHVTETVLFKSFRFKGAMVFSKTIFKYNLY